MIKVTLAEAEGHLAQLIEEAAAGQEVVITGSGKSTVRLVLLQGAEHTSPEPSKTIGHSLDQFFGTWSAEEEAEFLQTIEIFEQIGESFWK